MRLRIVVLKCAKLVGGRFNNQPITIEALPGTRTKGITSRYYLGDKALLDASDLVANETLQLMSA
jgi:hypothetical protein